jgi:starch synthase
MGTGVAVLARGLRALGHEVSVVLPLQRAAREKASLKKTGVKFSVMVGNAKYATEIFETTTPDGTQVFLVGRDEFFDRSGLYGNESGDYQDNSTRFVFFTKCAIELARRVDPAPEVIHSHGWQTALAGVFVRDGRLPFRTVFTPHGLEYQGNFWSYDFALTNLPGDYFSAKGLEFFGSLNLLKSGILFSDLVVLPGERFVAAAQTPSHGCGLEIVLRENASKLAGVPDGQDLDGWDPALDPSLASPFSLRKIKNRAGNAGKLAQAFDWDEGGLATFVVFAEASDGLAVLFDSLDRLLPSGVRVGLLGKPDKANRKAAEIAARKHRGRFGWLEDFTEEEARLALGGADFLLIPGPASPLSPWLMRGLLYGLIPVAFQAQGLFQLVVERRQGTGNGFYFAEASPDALVDACRKALGVISEPGDREALIRACLEADFSMKASAKAHEALYLRLVGASASRKKAA